MQRLPERAMYAHAQPQKVTVKHPHCKLRHFAAVHVVSANAPRSTDRDALALTLSLRCNEATSHGTGRSIAAAAAMRATLLIAIACTRCTQHCFCCPGQSSSLNQESALDQRQLPQLLQTRQLRQLRQLPATPSSAGPAAPPPLDFGHLCGMV